MDPILLSILIVIFMAMYYCFWENRVPAHNGVQVEVDIQIADAQPIEEAILMYARHDDDDVPFGVQETVRGRSGRAVIVG